LICSDFLTAPDEVAVFVNDDRPEAYERLVDRQGHRIKILAKQEVFEETGVPGGFFSLLLQTGFRSVTLQQRGDKATYEAHVLGSMTVADATAIFAKHDIHHPV
jgi:hypothetical protein